MQNLAGRGILRAHESVQAVADDGPFYVEARMSSVEAACSPIRGAGVSR